MYLLKTEASFDSAHFLSGYNGKCSNIHGHTWKLSVEICADSVKSEGQCRGMVIDFSELKGAVKALADEFDHTLIFEEGTLKAETIAVLDAEGFSMKEVSFRPTAENFAEHFYRCLKSDKLPVKRVYVYETAVNCAVYEE